MTLIEASDKPGDIQLTWTGSFWNQPSVAVLKATACSLTTAWSLNCFYIALYLYVGIATHQRELKVGLDLDGRVGL